MTCSIGACHKYLQQSDPGLCNQFYESTDYIFTTMNQSFVSTLLNDRILPFLIEDEECGDLISRLLCHYFFAPCAANGQLHLPLAVCPDECYYVQSACPVQWRNVIRTLGFAGLNTINCTDGSFLQGLAPCCVDAGIEITSELTKLNHASLLIQIPFSAYSLPLSQAEYLTVIQTYNVMPLS
jgi:hypothetical protein